MSTSVPLFSQTDRKVSLSYKIFVKLLGVEITEFHAQLSEKYFREMNFSNNQSHVYVIDFTKYLLFAIFRFSMHLNN